MKLDASKLLKGLATRELKTKQAVKLYGETSGKKLEKEAKNKAEWVDRTGRARGTMEGGAETSGSRTRIYLRGNMKYSKYLETSNGGKYAILEPTIEKNRKLIVEGLKKVIK